MSQPHQSPRNLAPARSGSGCVIHLPPREITSSLVDDMLFGAWHSLPDAETAHSQTSNSMISRNTQVPAPWSIRSSVVVRQPTQRPAVLEVSSGEQEQRLVIPPLARPATAKREGQTAAAIQPEQRTVTPATPRKAPEPAKQYTPPPASYTTPAAIPPRPTVAFSRPRSSSSFGSTLNLDEIRKWSTVLAGVVIVSLASYWGVSNVLGNSAPAMKTIPVKGTVTLNGKPAPGASVQLHPVAGSTAPIEVHPRGQVSESGQVEFTTFTTNDGIPVGEYIATISHMKVKVVDGETVAGAQLAPAIFTKASTSPVRVKVSAETRELTPLDFTKPSR